MSASDSSAALLSAKVRASCFLTIPCFFPPLCISCYSLALCLSLSHPLSHHTQFSILCGFFFCVLLKSKNSSTAKEISHAVAIGCSLTIGFLNLVYVSGRWCLSVSADLLFWWPRVDVNKIVLGICNQSGAETKGPEERKMWICMHANLTAKFCALLWRCCSHDDERTCIMLRPLYEEMLHFIDRFPFCRTSFL